VPDAMPFSDRSAANKHVVQHSLADTVVQFKFDFLVDAYVFCDILAYSI
jgi:hypothetical protein